MSDTVTAIPRDPAAGIHPRLLQRIEDTLSCHRRAFEAARHRARRLLMEVRSRVDHLEDTSGVPLAECRAACDALLETIDGLDALKAGDGVGPGLLFEQAASLVTVTDKLNAGDATQGLLAERPALSQTAQPPAECNINQASRAY